jgi:hypothetical protein
MYVSFHIIIQDNKILKSVVTKKKRKKKRKKETNKHTSKNKQSKNPPPPKQIKKARMLTTPYHILVNLSLYLCLLILMNAEGGNKVRLFTE